MSRTVMLVEESDIARAAHNDILSKQYTVVCVQSGAQAQQQLLENSTAVACVLLSLSCTDAFAFLDARRTDTLLHAIPVIGLLPTDVPQATKLNIDALQLDAADVINTPIQPELLIQRVRNQVRLRENAGLRRALQRDSLTGIFNHHTFVRRTAKLLRKREPNSYQLHLWDIEHFKLVNDLLGSTTGDQVLREIARFLDERLHGIATYARLQGDRFVFCCPAALYAPGELLAEVNQMLSSLELGMRLVLYSGIYPVDDPSLSIDQMCDRADIALKTAKGNDQMRYAFYDSAMRDKLIFEQSIAGEMSLALDGGQFDFDVQPLYNISTGEPNGGEALLRWRHPTRGTMAPADFVPLFESNGFITRLDAYMCEKVCQYQHALQLQGIEPVPVSVNLSAANFLNPALCDNLLTLTQRYQLQPALLRLEITEGTYTSAPKRLLEATHALKKHGFIIMLDDFGGGYSSLNMLKDLPVDILKVDLRFWEDLQSNSRSANLMASIVRMAKWLDISVVAEGVETQTQIDFLRSVGCDEAQGFFYAPPMSISAFSELLSNPACRPKYQLHRKESLPAGYDPKAVWECDQNASLLFNGIIGAIGLYAKTGDQLEILRVNDSYYELMGNTPQTMLQNSKQFLEQMETGEQQTLLRACEQAIHSQAVESAQVRHPHRGDQVMWLDIRVRHLGTVGLQDLYYFALSDCTKQKELESNMRLYQYGAVLLDAYNEVMEMNFSDNIAFGFSPYETNGGYQTYATPLDVFLTTMQESRIYPSDRAIFSKTCEQGNLQNAFYQQGRRSVSVEIRLKQSGKFYHWVRLTLHPMEDPTGKFRVLCCNRDIDEQKQTERIRAEYAVLQAKQQEQERYQLILEQTQTALLAWSPHAKKAEGNLLAQRYRIRDVSFSSLLAGDLPSGIADAEDIPAFTSFLRVLKTTSSAARLLRLYLTTGEAHWCKLGITMQRDATGSITALLATINDVDHEHRTQLQLDTQRIQNERRLSMLSHLYWTLPCCIVQLNLNDPPQPIFYNRACWAMLGYDTQEAFGDVVNHDLFSFAAPTEKERILAQLRHCRTHNTVENIEMTLTLPDGRTGRLRGNAALSHTSEGEPMLQLVLLDTTEQREQERRLEQTRVTLKHTTDMLQHLLENLPVGVTLFEFGSTAKALYVNSHAYDMFGLQKHQTARFMELLKMERFHLNSSQNNHTLQAIDDEGADMGGITHVQRDDGQSFWLRIYDSIVPQTNTPPLCYAVLVDVTRQTEIERDYNRQAELYRIVMEDSHQIFFDYDLEKDVMTYSIRTPANTREERQIESYLKSLRRSVVIEPSHISGFIACMKRHIRTRNPGSYEFMADFFALGSFRWYRAHFRTLEDERGTLYRMIGRVNDIHEEKQREEQLGQAKVFRRAVNSVSLFVFSFTLPQMNFQLLSCEDLDRSGFHPYLDYLMPDPTTTLIHKEEAATFADALDTQALTERFRSGLYEQTVPFRALKKDGSWSWLEMNLHLSKGESRGSISGVGYVKIIEDRVELERKASFDGLTQLLNRTTVEERVSQVLAQENSPCCLMIFDVDNFKSVNDLFGHRTGDDLLKDVASVMRSRLRQTDIVGRLGGDEFVALLKNATEAIAVEKANELLQSIAALNATFNNDLQITVSIGLASYPQNGSTFADLYAAADNALYAAKRLGKNRCCSAGNAC